MPSDRLLKLVALSGVVVAVLVAAGVAAIAQAPFDSAQGRPAGDVTFSQGHRADPAAQLPGLPPRRRRRADVARHLRRVGPWARSMKTRTALRSQRGAMPPWFVEKNIGIQKFKHDPSLSDEEIARIAKWADSGAPRGNPADMPKPLAFDSTDKWTIGEPDLILRSKDVHRAGDRPRLVGRLRARPDRPHRRSLCVGGRGPRGQRHPAGPAAPRPSADATSSTT